MGDLHFIDVEASSLTGYPVEVGWVSLSDDMAHRAGGTVLIKPDPEWEAVGYWDWNAEQMHGLTLERLHVDGLDVMDAARLLNDSLRGLPLLSDNLAFDVHWLSDLHSAAGVAGEYLVEDSQRAIARLRHQHAAALAGEDIVLLAGVMASEAGLVFHRAFDDALRQALLVAAVRVLAAHDVEGAAAGRRLRDQVIGRAREARARWGRRE